MDAIFPERLGNLHLVLLHLPIGFVTAAVLSEWWRWRRPSAEGAWLHGRLLAANAVATLLAAGAGLLLAEHGSYPAETLAWHRWSGVACAGLAVALWLVHAKGKLGVARVTLATLVAATIVAGHQGATLTHGESMTALWPEKKNPPVPHGENSAVAPAVAKPAEAARAAVEAPKSGSLFVQTIHPLLERSCIDCHGPEKSKGRLRLDSRAAALAAGKSGERAVVPGRPEESELLRRVRLPHDNDEAMPPGEEYEKLDEADIAALTQWIREGARWE